MTSLPPTLEQQPMTRTERDELGRLVRRRERFMKSQAKERSAHLLADFEQKLGALYEWDQDETWAALTRQAKDVAEAADVGLARRCEELGIPRQFRPKLSLSWYGRGENASKERRSELRKMAQTRIVAVERSAMSRIERWSLETQERLVAPALTSAAAQQFLGELPAVESLMPTFDESAVRKLIAGAVGE